MTHGDAMRIGLGEWVWVNLVFCCFASIRNWCGRRNYWLMREFCESTAGSRTSHGCCAASFSRSCARTLTVNLLRTRIRNTCYCELYNFAFILTNTLRPAAAWIQYFRCVLALRVFCLQLARQALRLLRYCVVAISWRNCTNIVGTMCVVWEDARVVVVQCTLVERVGVSVITTVVVCSLGAH